MILHKVSPENFKLLDQAAHAIAFKEHKEPGFSRYNFALVVADDTLMFAYSTLIEIDRDSVYMQHGGAMPPAKGNTKSKRAYAMMITWLKERYNRISTRIRNTNVPMIKFALSEGLIIDGVISYGREVYLSLGWGFPIE